MKAQATIWAKRCMCLLQPQLQIPLVGGIYGDDGLKRLALREQALVLDVRAIGLLCAVELKPREGAPGARAAEVAQRCFEAGVLVRASGENIVLSPPLIINQEQVAQVFSTLGKALEATR